MSKKEKIISTSFIVLVLIVLFGVFFITSSKVSKQEKIKTTENTKTKKVVLEISGVNYEEDITDGMSVYDLMSKLQSKGNITFKDKIYVGMGKLIEEINGIKSDGKRFWIYYVNNVQGQVGVSDYKIKPGDVISWKYEAF